MDKEYIKKMGLTEQVKRLRAIQEYTFITKPSLDEDDEAPDNSQAQQPGTEGDPTAQGGGEEGGSPMMGGTEDMPAGPQGDEEAPSGPVDGVGTDLPQDDGQPADMGGGDMTGGEPMQDGDEVIDVDQLTNTQQETDLKVDTVSAKVDQILNTVNNFVKSLEDNDTKVAELADEINALQAEFQRRNPTPEEKLNLRSQAGYPFNQTPRGYWDAKAADPNSNYQVSYDNNNPAEEDKEDHKYDILAQDIDNLDVKKVSDSLTDFPDLEDYLSRR